MKKDAKRKCLTHFLLKFCDIWCDCLFLSKRVFMNETNAQFNRCRITKTTQKYNVPLLKRKEIFLIDFAQNENVAKVFALVEFLCHPLNAVES